MKCSHCSTQVERNEWFCPNCKRSLPFARRDRRGTGRMGTFVGLAALSVAAAAIAMLNHGCQSPAQPGANIPPAVSTPGAPAAGSAPSAAPGPALPGIPGGAPTQAAKPAPMQPLAPRPGVGTGTVTVLTQPAVKTFVYLNGGSLLGETPLRNAAVPAGKHTLVFWSPEVGGRSKRPITVVAGESQVVMENMDGKHTFAEPKEATETAKAGAEKAAPN